MMTPMQNKTKNCWNISFGGRHFSIFPPIRSNNTGKKFSTKRCNFTLEINLRQSKHSEMVVSVTEEEKAYGPTGTRTQDLSHTVRALWPLSYRATRSICDNSPCLIRFVPESTPNHAGTNETVPLLLASRAFWTLQRAGDISEMNGALHRRDQLARYNRLLVYSWRSLGATGSSHLSPFPA